MTWRRLVFNMAVWAGVLTVFALAAIASPAEFHGLKVQPAQVVADFLLIDQHGGRFSMAQQRGRAVLLMFGYTYCVDVCPAMLGLMKTVYGHLGRETGRVRVLFVTTDPARDTPDRLKRYLALFNPDIVGLWGAPDALARVYHAYGIYPQRYTAAGSSAAYLVSHGTAVYLFDPAGTLRFTYPWRATPADLAQDIRLLLAGY